MRLTLAILLAIFLAAPCRAAALLNASYDATREFYQEYNTVFARHWKLTTGGGVSVSQSHGGSGSQALSVINGLPADAVSLALAYDVSAMSRAGLVAPGWEKRLPHDSCPYTSVIVFLVRKGNPKRIRDWDDLARPGVSVITPNPKTSGGARWNYLAAWGYALLKKGGQAQAARDFVAAVFANVPMLDAGARGAAITFVERGMGDVLIAWESEASFIAAKKRPGDFLVVTPALSILAEPPVAVVDVVARRNGTEELSRAYLEHLYSEEAQALAARHFFRPWSAAAATRAGRSFPKVKTFTVAEVFGGWESAQKTHFSDGGTFDQIYRPGTREGVR